MNNSDLALAFDFGGTKLAVALVNIKTGELEQYSTCLTPRTKTFTDSISAIEKLANQILHDCSNTPLSHVGISFGGSVNQDRQSVKRSVHVSGWDQFPIVEYFQKKYGVPTFLENDANAAALGEWAFGAGERNDNLLYIQLSTGIGAGLIINQQIWRGEGYAGEFGHIKTFGCSNQCVCGQKGCLESAFSGWAIQKAGQELFSSSPSETILTQLCNNDVARIDARMVFSAMKKGDPGATLIIQSGVEKLGIALSNTINLLDPAKVILGGSICKSKSLFSDQLDHILKRNVIRSIHAHLQMDYSHLSGNETLIGAALLGE